MTPQSGNLPQTPQAASNPPAAPLRPDWIAEPEPWPEPANGNDLLRDLRDLLQRFVVLPPWGPEALALWVLHTYAFELRDVCAYIGVESPDKRCGKSTLLAVLSDLVQRPVIAANISPPAFFHVIENLAPTLLIDEADTVLWGNDDLRGILHSGYTRKTAYVVRVSGASRASPRRPPGPSGKLLTRYSCWCPKVFAAIGRLPEVLADRCLVIRMQRKAAHEKCQNLRCLDASALRRRCARFVLDYAQAIRTTHPAVPDNLHDRAADVWEPLLVLADLAGGEWPGLARSAADALSASPGLNALSSLLRDLYTLFQFRQRDRIFSRVIVATLNALEERPWRDLKTGRNVTDLWLARQLRPFGIFPRTLRIGEERAKGYLLADCQNAFERYLSHADRQQVAVEFHPAPQPP